MLAITVGEPAGIGPELVAQLHKKQLLNNCEIIGDKNLLRAHCQQLEINTENLRISHVPLNANNTQGQLNPANAPYVLETIRLAAEGCIKGYYKAMVTAPIHKGIINDAGIDFSGHTEFLAEISGVKKVVMMLLNQHMRVALATTHIPLKEVANQITKDLLSETIEILYNDLQEKFAIRKPRIAVCGLNPHAGENGYLGQEEINIIEPTIDKMQKTNKNISGPIPADSLFTPERLKQYDAILAMYHDQGLTPLKYSGFGQSVNITLGLPFVRTSVDHGTALDIAGKNMADTGSFEAALELARNCAYAR